MAKDRQPLFVIDDETMAALVALDAEAQRRELCVEGAPPLILEEIPDEARERAKYDAGQQWFKLLSLAHSRLSRASLCDYAHDLTAQMIHVTTLEEIRAWCMRLEEEMSL